MTDPASPEHASAEVQFRIRASFGRQGLMHHLGAELGEVREGQVHVVLRMRDGLTQQGRRRTLVATGQQTLIRVAAGPRTAIGTDR